MSKKLLAIVALLTISTSVLIADDVYLYKEGNKKIKEVKLHLKGEKFTIKRVQKAGNKIHKLYETTHRGMIQPMIMAKGVETLGEIEFIKYMQKAQHDKNILIVDARTPDWYERLRIPGSVNIPYSDFYDKEDAESILEDFGAVKKNGKWDFTNAKTIVAYCNGFWCGQTPAMFKNLKYSLLKMGYPPSKLKYYRGGMQAWTALGLTVVGSDK
jgi:rhodanese-related sulfurtransferase